jgi:hypothetical protein
MKSFRKTFAVVSTIVALFACISPETLARPHTQAKQDKQVVAKLAQLLEQSGYPYRKAAENVWVVNFKGKSLTDINVFVTSAESLVVMGAVVAPKSSMKVTQEMTVKLLRIVHDIDRVKIGFDSDDDLFLRAEVGAKCLDLAEFKDYMEQVSAGTDKVHAAIKAYLAK